VRQENDAALEVLRVLAAREQDALAVLARRDLRRRTGSTHATPTPASRTGSGPHEKDRVLFERYWRVFDRLKPDKRLEAGRQLRNQVMKADVLLRAKLASPEPLDRARAVRIISTVGLVQDMEESLHRAGSDSDPVVRSLAVSTFAELPGPVTIRLLRTAINDPNERVQADAVEALDRLDVSERIACTEPKLASRNSRVRANAVKSLLRADHQKAGETLLDMLKDPLPAYRLSALWVVEQLCLRTAVGRVLEMSRSDPDSKVKRAAQRVMQNLDRGEAQRAEHELPALAGNSVEQG
jgi:HEAT repeat protein